MRTLDQIAEKSVLTLEQLMDLKKIIQKHGNYSEQAIQEEIDWFCTGLGMSDYYFKTTPVETIANHIEAIKAAEILSAIRQEEVVNIDLVTELENEAIYLVDDYHFRAMEVERRVQAKYPNHRLQSYRTLGKTRGVEHLRMYLVYKPQFNDLSVTSDTTDLKKIGDVSFLSSTTEETYVRYQEVIQHAQSYLTPYIQVTHKTDTDELRIMIVINSDSAGKFFANISDVLNSNHLVSNRKYIEHFANGKTVFAIYLNDILDEKVIHSLIEDISLIYVIPDNPLSDLFRQGELTTQETVFGFAARSFVHQFLSSYNDEYISLAKELQDSPELMGILRNLKTKLAKDTFTESRCWEAFITNYQFIKKTYQIFNKKFNPGLTDHDLKNDLLEIRDDINRNIKIELDKIILHQIITFIEVIQRTNFYRQEKVSLAFVLDPVFLNKIDFTEKPFGILFIIGSEFRGFHIRFRDIARGGIRIVKSQSIQSFMNNSDYIFDENYNLASTQQKKNKDIPEGGSKGTILLRWGFQDKAETAFKKYIDGILDLILPDESTIDYYQRDLILFLGPDEHTAELMEWAALRAKVRGYQYWKAFSTGKPLSMGGIPHDLYGMTTNSVHQYVIHSLQKLGIDEKNISKVMTGGPDGDLGSNEILISQDKIMAIIDGSGVLYDPLGLDREELSRLARERRMSQFYNRSKFSSKGFFIDVNDVDIQLPNGEKILNGFDFRNNFHLHPFFKADLFVPCGGRPASITINNWTQYLDEKGNPRFKIIVEGANLFITQDARLRLEEKGVIIYKDASANKGGVTSSSLEVFASLALTDSEWNDYMCVNDQRVPSFRERYVNEILDIIRLNASMEFEVIWQENMANHTPRTILTDMVSNKINMVTDAIYSSDLTNNLELFRKVITRHTPPVLLETVGMDAIFRQVPASYLKAIFASWLASSFVYKYGLCGNEINFYNFLQEI